MTNAGTRSAVRSALEYHYQDVKNANQSTGAGKLLSRTLATQVSWCESPRKERDVSPARSSSMPETDLARINRWVEQENERIPSLARDEVRIEANVDDRSVTILECRPPWDPERRGPEWTRVPVARLRYTRSRQEWILYWPDRNSRFHQYDLAQPTANVAALLQEIDRDPTSIFWG
jgi:hypothetical protein